MGALVKATRWVRETFEEGSRPTIRQVAEWIRAEQVPGRIIGDEVYVDADRFAVQARAPAPEKPSGLSLLQ